MYMFLCLLVLPLSHFCAHALYIFPHLVANPHFKSLAKAWHDELDTRPSRRPHMSMFLDFITQNVIVWFTFQFLNKQHLALAFWYGKIDNSNLMFSEQWRFNFKCNVNEDLEGPGGSPLIALFIQTELVFPRPRSMTSSGLLLGAPYGGCGTTACLLWSGWASKRSSCVPPTIHYSRRNCSHVGKKKSHGLHVMLCITVQCDIEGLFQQICRKTLIKAPVCLTYKEA